MATTSIPVESVSVLLQIFFIILTGLQGPLIFIMQCARSEDARNEWIRWAHTITRNSLFDNSSKKTSTEDQYKYPSNSAKYMHGYSSDIQKKGDKRNKRDTPAIPAHDLWNSKEENILSAQEQPAFDSTMKEDLFVNAIQVMEEDSHKELQCITIADEMDEKDPDLSFLNSHCDNDDVITSDAF